MSNEGMGRGGGVPAARELHHGLLAARGLARGAAREPQFLARLGPVGSLARRWRFALAIVDVNRPRRLAAVDPTGEAGTEGLRGDRLTVDLELEGAVVDEERPQRLEVGQRKPIQRILAGAGR